MEFLGFILASLVMCGVVITPILKSFEYEGDKQCVAITAAIMHIMLACVIGLSVIILIGTLL